MNPTNTAKLGPTGAWQTLSVEEFFSDVNWDNVAVQKMPLPTVKAGERSVNPNMTVSEFFSAISWEGEAVIAAPSNIDMTAPVQEEGVDDMTLDDFFGSF